MGNAVVKSDGTTEKLIAAASKGDLATLKDLLAQAHKAGTDVKTVLEKVRHAFDAPCCVRPCACDADPCSEGFNVTCKPCGEGFA